MIQEFITYGQYSGSKINENKTEILPFGKWISDKNNLPNQYIRDKIKIFGIIYGNNQENFKNTINNLKYYINNWEKYNLNLKEKINVTNIYIQSQLQYSINIIDIADLYIREYNKICFQYIWKGVDKIKRDTIMQQEINGGLGLINIKIRQTALHLQRITKIKDNLKEPWTQLYIFWFGFNLQFINKEFASIKYTHSFNIPNELNVLRQNLLKYRYNQTIWNYTKLKPIYIYLLTDEEHKSNIEIKNPDINWKYIGQNFSKIKSHSNKVIIHKYLHKILPTGEYLVKYNVFPKIPKCTNCGSAVFTIEHLIEFCDKYMYKQERLDLIKNISNINKQIKINTILYQFGNNDININNREAKQICNLLFQYVIMIWKTTKKLNS